MAVTTKPSFFSIQSADASEFVAALAGCRGIGGNLKEGKEEEEEIIHEWNPIVKSNQKFLSQGRNQKKPRSQFLLLRHIFFFLGTQICKIYSRYHLFSHLTGKNIFNSTLNI